MRRVALVVFFVLGCGGSPAVTEPSAPPTNEHASARRGEWEMCDVGGECVPCADETTPRCQLLLGAFVEPDGSASSLAPPVSTTRPQPRTAPAPVPTVPLPRARTDGSGTSNDPALAAATTAYARLVASPFSLETAPADAEAGIHELIARIQRASAIVQDVDLACSPLEAVPSPSRLAALVLHADALDYLASHTAAATLPMPLDIAARTRGASPAVRAELEHVFRERIGEAMATQARPVFCLAVVRYQRVLELDPGNARATQQLAAYGAEFVASCQ